MNIRDWKNSTPFPCPRPKKVIIMDEAQGNSVNFTHGYKVGKGDFKLRYLQLQSLLLFIIYTAFEK